jgi:hypothetical protein
MPMNQVSTNDDPWLLAEEITTSDSEVSFNEELRGEDDMLADAIRMAGTPKSQTNNAAATTADAGGNGFFSPQQKKPSRDFDLVVVSPRTKAEHAKVYFRMRKTDEIIVTGVANTPKQVFVQHRDEDGTPMGYVKYLRAPKKVKQVAAEQREKK